MLGAAGIAICIMGLMLSFAWSGFKSDDCHEKINTASMNERNLTPPADGKTMCDHGDDMSTLNWWLSAGCGVLGIVFSYNGIKGGLANV